MFDDFMEEVRKRQKIREIKRKLRAVEQKISDMASLKESFTACREGLNTSLESWNTAYESYNQIELAPEIQLIDSFEGVSAQQLATDVPQTINSIAESAVRIECIAVAIGAQIFKIDLYVAELEKEKIALEAELAALS